MKLAIVGSRDFNDYELMKSTVNNIPGVTAIVSGGAKGADKLAERYADQHNLEKIIFLAEWDKYGISAGMRRNADIVAAADHVIAFWDGQSSGTKNSIDRAKKANKLLKIITYK